MEDMLWIVAGLLLVVAAVLLFRARARRKSEQAAEEARRHREAGKAQYERDQREAASIRERLQQQDPPMAKWGQSYVANRDRLKAEVPPPPHEDQYPGMDAIPFHREIKPVQAEVEAA